MSEFNFEHIKPINLKSTITCPECGFQKEEIMPEDSCQFFYECENCKAVLKPQKGDCCVYCSYGTVKCPPIQQGKNCC
ncbi:MAG: GDCCVxC domain-containing (seleno)protein [Flavobacteriales bacterium]